MVPTLRRFAGSLLVVGAFLAALAIGSYKELDTHYGARGSATHGPVITKEVAEKFGLYMTPAWAIPVAVTVGVLGLVLATLIYRGRNE